MKVISAFILGILTLASADLVFPETATQESRPRARDVGLVVGTLQTGKYNALNWDKKLPPARND